MENEPDFEWDEKKNRVNIEKHGMSFYDAQEAFFDPKRIIAEDVEHSIDEKRYYCFGKVQNAVATVRFTFRQHKIRIIGSGYWREGKKVYEKKNGKI